MFKDLMSEALKATAAATATVSEAASAAVTNLEEGASSQPLAPGAIRAVAIALGLAGDIRLLDFMYRMILADVGIMCAADLEKAKWMARDKDVEKCMVLFD